MMLTAQQLRRFGSKADIGSKNEWPFQSVLKFQH
jgi:hypothetical protein